MRVGELFLLLGRFFLLLGKRLGVFGGSLFAVVGVFLLEGESRLVASAPVIFEFSIAPCLGESRLTGVFGGGVVEIPTVVGVHLELLGCVVSIADIVSRSPLLGKVFLARSLFRLFLFSFHEFIDESLCHLLLLFGRQHREAQQRVLESYILGIHCKFVEHIRAFFEQGIVGVFLVEHTHRLGIARLSVGIVAHIEIERAESDLANRLFDTVAGAFLHTKTVIGDCVGGVGARKIQIADCVVDLVEIFLVTVVSGHPFEGVYLRLDVGACKHLALAYPRIEFSSVFGVVRAAHMGIGAVCTVFLPGIGIELPQEEVKSVFLSTLSATSRAFEVWDSLIALLGLDKIGCGGEVVFLAEAFRREFRRLDAGNDIVSLVIPPLGAVATRLPQFGGSNEVGHPGEMPCDVVKSSGGAEEIPFHVLRFCH